MRKGAGKREMWFSRFWVSVVINNEGKMCFSESWESLRGREGFLVAVQHTHSHTDVSFRNLLKATLDLSRTQQYNEKFRPKRVHVNEDQTGKWIPWDELGTGTAVLSWSSCDHETYIGRLSTAGKFAMFFAVFWRRLSKNTHKISFCFCYCLFGDISSSL